MAGSPGGQFAATVGGLIALLCWSTTVALFRSVSESVGVVQGGAIGMIAGGTIGLLQYLANPATRPSRSRWHLMVLGSLFVAYQVGLLLAVGLSEGRDDVLVVSALNYLWPVLSVVLSIPILGCCCRAWIVPAGAIAILGEVLVVLGGSNGDVAASGEGGPQRWLLYILAAGAAVCWAVYSNLTRRFAGKGHDNPVPLFLLFSGLVLLLLVPLFPGGRGWTARTAWELVFIALVPQLLAYSLWDWAMSRGDARLVTVVSYLVPVVSAAVSCVYLQIQPGWMIWAGTALLVVGAAGSYHAVAAVGISRRAGDVQSPEG